MKCSDEELGKLTITLIEDYGDLFTFNQLISDLCLLLDRADCFEKEPRTLYEGGYRLSQPDSDKVQKIVWEMMWNRQLMLDLYNDEYRYSPDKVSFRLIKVKK